MRGIDAVLPQAGVVMEGEAEIAALLRRELPGYGMVFAADTVINGDRGIHDEEAEALIVESGRRLGIPPEAFDDFPFEMYFERYGSVGVGLPVAAFQGVKGWVRRLFGGVPPAPPAAKVPLTVAAFTALMLGVRDAYAAARGGRR